MFIGNLQEHNAAQMCAKNDFSKKTATHINNTNKAHKYFHKISQNILVATFYMKKEILMFN